VSIFGRSADASEIKARNVTKLKDTYKRTHKESTEQNNREGRHFGFSVVFYGDIQTGTLQFKRHLIHRGNKRMLRRKERFVELRM